MSGKTTNNKKLVAESAAAPAVAAAQPPKTPTKSSPAPKGAGASGATAAAAKSVSPAPGAKAAATKASPAPKAAKAPRSASASKKGDDAAAIVAEPPNINAQILELILDLTTLSKDQIEKRVKKIAKQHNITLARRRVKEADEYNGVKNPRKPCSAFMFYVKENRERIVAEKPDLTFANIGKELGKLWQATTDVNRAKFFKLAEDDKARYETEITAFRAAKAAHEAAQKA